MIKRYNTQLDIDNTKIEFNFKEEKNGDWCKWKDVLKERLKKRLKERKMNHTQKLRKIVEQHWKESKLTCPKDCWCWEWDILCSKQEELEAKEKI